MSIHSNKQVHEEEHALIERAKTEPEAFGMLYESYLDRIYRYVYYRVGNTQDAEDITARVFFKALTHLGSYRHQGLPFSAWLYRIAHNQVANFHRDNSRYHGTSLESLTLPGEASRQPLPENESADQQELAYLLSLVRDLPAYQRELLILKAVDNLSNQEIAVIMRRSESAIKSLYHRVLRSLRARMEAQHGQRNL